jgi:hypothetical protein
MTASAAHGTRRPLYVGLALVAVYVMVVAVTMGTKGGHVRPLFEGVGPSARYQWVNPPADFAAGNVAPHPTSTAFDLGTAGSSAASVTSSEGQFVLNLPGAAIPVRPGDTRATVDITPLDPATLGRLPARLLADGNAYRFTVTYQPSQQPLGAISSPGNVIMQVPGQAETMLFSPDGRSWQKLPVQPVGAGIGASFSQAGYYLAAAQRATTPSTSGSSRTGSIVVVALITVALALVLGFAPSAVRRARRRRAPPAGPTASGRRQPPNRPGR